MSEDFYQLDPDKTFLVSQKALVIKDRKLLMLKAVVKIPGARTSWELPGGLLELDEPLRDGLAREVEEETGLEVIVGKSVATWDFWLPHFTFRDGRTLAARVILVAYRCDTNGDQIRLSKEHTAYKWVGKNDLAGLDFPEDLIAALTPLLA